MHTPSKCFRKGYSEVVNVSSQFNAACKLPWFGRRSN